MTEDDEMDEFLEAVGEEFNPDDSLPSLLQRIRTKLIESSLEGTARNEFGLG